MLPRSRRLLETIAQTSIQQVANEVQRENLRKLDGLFTHEVWVATLDTRTCPRCAALDGQRYPVEEGPQWPLHPVCRCRRIPEIPGAGPGRRASRDGQIPGDVNFAEWLRIQPRERQNFILGRARADLFREGKLNGLDPMILLGPEHRLVKLDELNARLRRRR